MITAQDIINWAKLSKIDPLTDPHLSLVVPAVNAYVDSLPSIARNTDGTWAGTTKLGAVMLGARLYQRKNSQGGIESAGEVVTYVARYDSDIARLLRLDNFRKPQVG